MLIAKGRSRGARIIARAGHGEVAPARISEPEERMTVVELAPPDALFPDNVKLRACGGP